MSMYAIEKGVPVPSDIGPGRPRKYPFREMQVGDSLELPNRRSFRSARTTAFKLQKTTMFKFVGSEAHLRIWRVA